MVVLGKRCRCWWQVWVSGEAVEFRYECQACDPISALLAGVGRRRALYYGNCEARARKFGENPIY